MSEDIYPPYCIDPAKLKVSREQSCRNRTDGFNPVSPFREVDNRNTNLPGIFMLLPLSNPSMASHGKGHAMALHHCRIRAIVQCIHPRRY